MSVEIVHTVNTTTKVQILDKALLLFAEKGFHGASTRDIAVAAGVNHALIKYHFGSKEALWKSAVDQLFGRLDNVLNHVFKQWETIESPEERFRVFLKHYIRYCADHPEHARIMVQESTSENERLAWAVDKHISRTRKTMENALEDLFTSGTLSRMSKMSLRFIIASACQSIFTFAAEAKLLYGVSTDHEAQIEAHIDAISKLFLRC